MENSIIQSYSFHSHGLKTKITAVEYLDDYVIVGEGNRIQVYRTNDWLAVDSIQVFKENCIHGIRIQVSDHENIAVYGGKGFTVLKNLFGSTIFRLKKCSDEQQLEDWIWDVQWMSNFDVAVVLAHNTVLLWDWIAKSPKKYISCEENCILYSATLVGTVWPDIVCIAGTVFSQVVIWSLSSQSDRAKVLHRLRGHQGVIFCVTYSVPLQLLCSTSDDRSLRLWKLQREGDGNLWESGRFDLLHVLFGHESRVWRAVIANDYVLSIGEDSVLSVWSHCGELLANQKYQSGGLLSLAVSRDEKHVVIGGGSLAFFDIDKLLQSQKSTLFKLPENKNESDFPRSVALFGKNSIVVSTDLGNLLVYDFVHKTWRTLHSDATFRSYSLLSVSPCRELVTLSNISGQMLLLRNSGTFEDLCNKCIHQVHQGKVFSALWISEKEILTCGPEGKMILWDVLQDLQLDKRHSFILPASKQRWPSAACGILDECWAVGDRVGNLHVYRKTQEWPLQMCKGVHGRTGITHICFSLGNIYSAGQDGCVLVHRFLGEKLVVLHSIKKPSRMEWIGKVFFTNTDILLLGFYTTYFSVWSHSLQRPLLELQCGGGHRSWDFSRDITGEVDFVCIRRKEIQLWNRYRLNEHVLRAGFHGHKIWCISQITCSDRGIYIATGGEDNSIVLSHLKEDSTGHTMIEHLERLGTHISSVRALTSCSFDGYSQLLVSAGGRAQVVVWKLSWTAPGMFQSRVLVNEFLWSTDRPHRKPWQEHNETSIPDPQTRYMDVAVCNFGESFKIALGCSDACLRVYDLDLQRMCLELQFLLQTEFCILKLSLLNFGPSFLLAGSTDGTVTFWKWSKCDTTKDALLSLASHQNGVNAIDLHHIADEKWLMATGGDDNGIVVHVLAICPVSVNVEAFHSVPSAHAAQITGLRFLNADLLLSVGIDQKLCLWKCTTGNQSIFLEPLASVTTIIPDVSAMTVLHTCTSSAEWKVIVVGEGTEIFRIGKESPSILIND